jgi:hypothetical protein
MSKRVIEVLLPIFTLSLIRNGARLPDPLQHLADVFVVPVAKQVPNVIDVHLHGVHESPLLD